MNRETLNLKAGFNNGKAPICEMTLCHRCRHKSNERGDKLCWVVEEWI